MIRKIDWFLILLLALSVIAVLPLFHSGFYLMHDNTQVARVFEMTKALSDGVFPVRWVKDLGYGYGYPIFNFYAPFPYYIAGLINILGFDSLLATKLVFALGIFSAGITMYIFLKKFFSGSGAVLGAIIYLYFPYHAVDAFVRGDLGEIYSYAFYPLVFYGLLKLHSGKKTKKEIIASVILSSASIALVIISHNLSAFMLFIFVGMFMVSSVIFHKQRLTLILSYVGVLVLAFLISSFYTFPALFEMGYTNVLSQVGGGASYFDHYVCFSQLWSSPWGFGGSTKGCIDGLSFALGKLNIAISVLSFIVLFFVFKKSKQIFIALFSLVSLIFSIFLMLQISGFVWRLPYFAFLQYPWRFLAFTGFFIAVLSAFCADSIKLLSAKAENPDSIGDECFERIHSFSCEAEKKPRAKQSGARGASLKSNAFIAFVILGIFLTIYINGKHFTPQKYLNVNSSYFTDPNYIKTVTSKISDEYLPGNFDKSKGVQNTVFAADNAKVDMIINKTTDVKADIYLSQPSRLNINIAYFPAWKMYIDGKEQDYLTDKGIMYTSLEAGKHTVELKFIETPIENLGDFLSIIGILSTVFLGIIAKGRIYGRKIT